MIAQLVLLSMALVAAWRPAESYAGTAILLAAAVLLMVPWAWCRTGVDAAGRMTGALILWACFFLMGQAGGWDRGQALLEIFLIAGLLTMIWLASREVPSERILMLFSLGIAGLALWGLLQSWGGLEFVRPAVDSLPEHLRVGALARIDQRRSFASLFLPSHLSVLLATVLPILVERIRRDAWGLVCGAATVLVVAGLVSTRSPVGGALALLAFGAVFISVRRRVLFWVLGVIAFGCIAFAGLRPDVLTLEPVVLRLDNWTSALWVFSMAPVVGVGLGGFAQAAQAVPWAVGNHPLHAHSMPFEMLAEAGIFGLAAWLFLTWWLVKLSMTLWRRRRGLAVALLVIPAHNLVDFSLYTSAVALPWAVLLGWGLATLRSDEEAQAPVSEKLRLVPVIGSALALALALLSLASSLFSAAARTEDPVPMRMAWALRAAEIAPWRTEPVETVGAIALELGDRESARSALSLVRSRQWQRPRSASRALLCGRLSIMDGDVAGGIGQMWRAAELQPYDARRRREFDSIVEMAGHDSR